jgi:hypothetical protein
MIQSLLPPTSPTFAWMESQTDWILIWLMAFFPIILIKIALLKIKGVSRAKDSMFFTEAIGLPLTFMQPVAFARAILYKDWLGAVITLWWGPGFLFVVCLVIWARFTDHKLNWATYRVVISWLCKILYLVYVALCLLWGLPKLIFALSAWIASDQIEKSFASLDADRTRRSFHDFWLIRILYPSFLFIPFFVELNDLAKAFGCMLFILWVAGIYYVVRNRKFMDVPDNPSLLRNMMYFSRKK